MAIQNAVVAIYDDHTKAEEAVKALEKSGFDMNKLSIVGSGGKSAPLQLEKK